MIKSATVLRVLLPYVRRALALVFGIATALCAAAPRAYPVTSGVDIAAQADELPLAGHFSFLEDRTGTLDAAAALSAPDWKTMPGDSLNRGWTKSTIWLRGEFYNSGASAVTRWLVVGAPRLESVRFFVFSPGSPAPRASMLSGTAIPLKRQAVAANTSIFPVTLAPGERIEAVLAVHSRSSVEIEVGAWRPIAFREHEGRELAIQMLLVALPVVVALYALVQGLVLRDAGFLLLAAWSLIGQVHTLAVQGYLYRYALTGGGEWVLRMPGTLAPFIFVVYGFMTTAFVDVNRIAAWKWTYRVLIGALAACVAWNAWGDYRAAAFYTSFVLGVFFLAWIASMLDGWRRGLPNARLFVLSFAPTWVIFIAGLLGLQGILQQSWLANLQMIWALEISLLAMMVSMVVGRSLQLYRRHMASQQALLDAQALEQQRLEQTVAERTRELHASLIAANEANEAKTDFLARVSHDLRTPLTSIIGYAELVQQFANPENAQRGGIIRRSARHMLAMVNDLIDYARGGDPDALQVAPVYLHALLESIAQEGAELARRHGNRFVSEIDGFLPPIVELDAKRLRRILVNLLDNAAKYTRGGLVEFHVDCRSRSGPDQCATLVFRIRDHGCGIAEQDLRRIFEPFQRLDQARAIPGAGLGLAIASQWVERMQGELDIASTPGAGTTASVTLAARLAAEDAIAHHDATEPAEAMRDIDGAGRRIWLAEDTADIRQLLVLGLSSQGFEVEAFPDGLALIEHMARHLGRPLADGAPRARGPDLVLTDYLMPGANGLAVLEAARRRLPGVPVMLLSAMPEFSAGFDDDGMLRFDASLLKPVHFPELLGTMARLLGDGQGGMTPDASPSLPPTRPPGDALAVACQLIDLGAVSDLADWLGSVDGEHPECQAFVREGRRLLLESDLAALRSLCAD